MRNSEILAVRGFEIICLCNGRSCYNLRESEIECAVFGHWAVLRQNALHWDTAGKQEGDQEWAGRQVGWSQEQSKEETREISGKCVAWQVSTENEERRKKGSKCPSDKSFNLVQKKVEVSLFVRWVLCGSHRCDFVAKVDSKSPQSQNRQLWGHNYQNMWESAEEVGSNIGNRI